MNRLVRYFVHYPIASHVLLFLILAVGYLSYINLNSSFFPERESHSIRINIPYIGASAEAVEKGVVTKIEQAIKNIPGVDEYNSVSRDGSGAINVEVGDLYDPQEVLAEIKNAMDALSSLPSDIEQPTISIQQGFTGAMWVAMNGDFPKWTITKKAQEFREGLLQVKGISQVEILGIQRREISVEVDKVTLAKYNLSLSEIQTKLRNLNKDYTGGVFKSSQEEMVFRFTNQTTDILKLNNFPIRNFESGKTLYLQDIANVREVWEDAPNRAYLNGLPCVMIKVSKTVDEDIIFVSNTTREFIEKFQRDNPKLNVIMNWDTTVYLQQRIVTLQKNGTMGVILVAIMLAIFLNWKLSIWVALGIPISFAGMFILANLAGITINVISLFGMIVVVGMLVDDAIVVAEQIYQEYENGLSAYDAATKGVEKVIKPVSIAVLTTIIAFIPFFYFEGGNSAWYSQIAFVVIAALIFSLVESFFILPVHLSHSRALQPKDTSVFRQRFDTFLDKVIHQYYSTALKWCFSNKLAVTLISIIFLCVSYALWAGGAIKYTPRPSIDRDNFKVNVEMAPGTLGSKTDSILAFLEEKIWETGRELEEKYPQEKPVITKILRRIEDESHKGLFDVYLKEGGSRSIASFEVIQAIQTNLDKLPVPARVIIGGGFWGKAVNISIQGKDLKQLEAAKNEIMEQLKLHPKLKNVEDNTQKGKRELHLKLKPLAAKLGLTSENIIQQIRGNFFGLQVQRIQRGDDELWFWVRGKLAERSQYAELKYFPIQIDSETNVYLSDIADFEQKYSNLTISHVNGERQVGVWADAKNPREAIPALQTQVRQDIVEEVLKKYPNVRASFEERRMNTKLLSSMAKYYPMVILCMFLILLMVFNSGLDAFVVIVMIPFGLAGTFFGHVFYDLNFFNVSIYGAIALTGIVINDSIVFVDKIKTNLREGLELRDAVYDAGKNRLRPIFLTTATTVAGFLPLLSEKGLQVQFLIPMGISISYGLIFGSIFILFFLPVLYLALWDIKNFFGKKKAKNA